MCIRDRAIGIEEEGGIVGGYIYNKEKYNARLLETIHKILDLSLIHISPAPDTMPSK